MGIRTNKGGEQGEWAQLFEAAFRVAEQAVAHPAFQQIGAAALQLGASCAAFNLTLAITHVTAGCLRIHCATPLLAPLWGAASVAAASVAAGHVSRSTLAALRLSHCDAASGKSVGLARALAHLPRQLLISWDAREAMVDAMVGPLLYKMLFRRSFRQLLPSHLALPGAFGRMHIPTSSAEYSTAAEKAQLSVIFGRDGCHHCGTYNNGVIGDHMPPYKVVRDALAAREAASSLEKALTKAADFLGLKDESLKQVYYAQCRTCSGRQAQLMRNGTRTTILPGLWPPELVVHNPGRLATRPATSGVLVGLRYYVAAAVRQGTGSRDGGAGGDAMEAVGGVKGERGSGGSSGGWRWLWEQRPRRWYDDVKERAVEGLCRGGVGEVLLVLSGGEAEDLVDLEGCDNLHGPRRGFPELFEYARGLSTPAL